MNETIKKLAENVLDGVQLSREQGLDLLSFGEQYPDDLLYWSNIIRERYFQNQVRICSIVPGALGGCSQNCAFCAQSVHYDTGIDKSPKLLTDEQILSAAKEAQQKGVPNLGIVYSGKRVHAEELDRLIDLVQEMKDLYGVEICAAFGILEKEDFEKLRKAGFVRYNHNIETSRRHFSNIVTTHEYADRIQTIRNAMEAGFKVCAGGIFGIGENDQDRVDMAIELRQLQVDTVPLNFLHPIPGTPLGNSATLKPLEILRIIALFRFMMPKTNLKVAGGRVLNLRQMQSWIFRAGCTAILSGNYLTTAGCAVEEDLQMLEDLGLSPILGHKQEKSLHKS